MKVKNNIIHIALAFDQNFITPFYVLITSIFHNNKENAIYLHVIATGIEESEISRIKNYVQQNKGEINFYEVDQEYVSKFVILEADRKHFTPAIFYRFFFPFLIPSTISRLLYLDVDIVVIKDLAELYYTNIEPFPVAAVADTGVEIYDFGSNFLSNLGITEKDQYFNSGVLLIDTKEWKNQQISEKAIRFLTSHPEKITFPDQDALNVVLKNNWFKLDKRYNLMKPAVPVDLPINEIMSFLKDKVIIHFTTKHKPWLALGNNRLRFLYHFYLKHSPQSNQKKYVDFKYDTVFIKKYAKLRLLEFYFDHPKIANIWRSIKEIKLKLFF